MNSYSTLKTIHLLKERGLSVKTFTPYHYRVEGYLDIYTVNERFHNIKTNERGSFFGTDPTVFILRYLTGNKKVTVSVDRYKKIEKPQLALREEFLDRVYLDKDKIQSLAVQMLRLDVGDSMEIRLKNDKRMIYLTLVHTA